MRSYERVLPADIAMETVPNRRVFGTVSFHNTVLIIMRYGIPVDYSRKNRYNERRRNRTAYGTSLFETLCQRRHGVFHL